MAVDPGRIVGREAQIDGREGRDRSGGADQPGGLPAAARPPTGEPAQRPGRAGAEGGQLLRRRRIAVQVRLREADASQARAHRVADRLAVGRQELGAAAADVHHHPRSRQPRQPRPDAQDREAGLLLAGYDVDRDAQVAGGSQELLPVHRVPECAGAHRPYPRGFMGSRQRREPGQHIQAASYRLGLQAPVGKQALSEPGDLLS
jgi:hypothetical protein